jgi:hypothetical protein
LPATQLSFKAVLYWIPFPIEKFSIMDRDPQVTKGERTSFTTKYLLILVLFILRLSKTENLTLMKIDLKAR